MTTAVLNDRGAERVRGGHPWVYEAEILGWEPAPPEITLLDPVAAPVALRDRRGRELGIADYSPQSKIRLRLLSLQCVDAVVADRAFFRKRIAAAIAYRRHVVGDSDAYRVVASEADGLPGLIVDRYGEALVVQTLTWAMAARQPMLIELLEELLEPSILVERNEAKVRSLEGLDRRAGLLRGGTIDGRTESSVAIHGLKFQVDLLGGQKTGGFLDQRENWAAAAAYAAAWGCQTALDVFTYQGGFALHLARAGLTVEAVDSSRPALEAAERNAAANRIELDLVEANAFDLLRDYDQTGKRFDLVVLDPPAFAKSRTALKTAAAGYKEINLRAMKLLRPGGILVSCSCSHHLSESHLLEILAAAAHDARRDVRVLERRGQAKDHPVMLAMPETNYLKCIVAVVA